MRITVQVADELVARTKDFRPRRGEPMIFLREGSAAVVLTTLTLLLQCAGVAAVIRWARPSFAPGALRLGAIRSAMLMMRLMTAFIGLHVLEILLWTAFYRWLCFPLWESAFYFSAASYATVGYGDVVLPQMWRTLGPVESIIGVLMCGLSASFLFAIVSRLVDREARASHLPITHRGGKVICQFSARHRSTYDSPWVKP